MTKKLTEEQVEFITERLISNAIDAVAEEREHEADDFYKGRRFAYYEMLDTLKNQLLIDEQDLHHYGLDMELEKVLTP